jgi:hypothetical protein
MSIAKGCLLVVTGLLSGLLLVWTLGTNVPPAQPEALATAALPRFTEEREAAALYFVKKHLPDLMPFFDELKKSSPTRYEREIRDVFHVTELLAELRDDPRRHDLELKIWKAENQANVIVARLAISGEVERKKLEPDLQKLAKELADLEVQVLVLKSEQLTKELAELNNEVAKAKDNADKQAKERYETLLDKALNRKK